VIQSARGFLFLFRRAAVPVLVLFDWPECQQMLLVVVLTLVVPVEFQLAVGRLAKPLVVGLCQLLFGFGLGKYHQPYINSVSK
jgi:hypothetical protein